MATLTLRTVHQAEIRDIPSNRRDEAIGQQSRFIRQSQMRHDLLKAAADQPFTGERRMDRLLASRRSDTRCTTSMA
jgi:hypothetical protein